MNATLLPARLSGGRLWIGALLACALVAAGCSKDKLLEVNDPNVLLPQQVASKDALPADFAGALSDFQLSYSGSGGGPLTEGMINISGLLCTRRVPPANTACVISSGTISNRATARQGKTVRSIGANHLIKQPQAPEPGCDMAI